MFQFTSVQSLRCVRLVATPWIAAHQKMFKAHINFYLASSGVQGLIYYMFWERHSRRDKLYIISTTHMWKG